MDAPLEDRIRDLLALPRDDQLDAALALIAALPPSDPEEAWNTAFGPGSLFEAWTSTSVARAVYTANATVLRTWLDARPDWLVVEVGAGDGRLWQRVLRDTDRGTLWVIDPSEEACDRVRAVVPSGVEVVRRTAEVQSVALPQADAVVCSLTLHHIAGTDVTERREHGLEGPGKLEVLRAFRDSLRPRQGRLVLTEADVFCDLGLPPGARELADNLLDSYVRRCGRSIVEDLSRGEPDPSLRARWRAVLRHWCLEQVRLAEVPIVDRDVYELTVDRWLALLQTAGLRVVVHRFTDALPLFHQYVAVPENGGS